MVACGLMNHATINLNTVPGLLIEYDMPNMALELTAQGQSGAVLLLCIMGLGRLARRGNSAYR